MLGRKGFLDFVFHSYGKELLTFAWQHAGVENAEDLVQEAYLRMLQHPNPEAIENPRAFLYRTTLNLSIDQHRRQTTRARFHSLAMDTDAELECVTDYGQVPEDHLAAQQALDRLNTILMELPELTRFAFVLHRLEGLSHNEVAHRLDISVRSSERRTAQATRHVLSRFEYSV